MRKHRRKYNNQTKEINPNHMGANLDSLERVNVPDGKNDYSDVEAENPLAEIGAELIYTADRPFFILHDSNIRKKLGDYGIIGEEIGAGRRSDRNFAKSGDPYSLSVYDVLFAYQLGLIGANDVDRTYEELLQWGMSVDDSFMSKLSVYFEFREKGLIVMDGIRYGADFTVYTSSAEEFHDITQNMNHSIALVDVLDNQSTLTGSIKGEHLARSIGKEYVIADTKEPSVRNFIEESRPRVIFKTLNTEKLGVDSNHDLAAQIAKRMNGVDMIPWELSRRY